MEQPKPCTQVRELSPPREIICERYTSLFTRGVGSRSLGCERREQCSSASRLTAGGRRIFALAPVVAHAGAVARAFLRFDTVLSRPMAQACWKAEGPLPSMWLYRRMPDLVSARSRLTLPFAPQWLGPQIPAVQFQKIERVQHHLRLSLRSRPQRLEIHSPSGGHTATSPSTGMSGPARRLAARGNHIDIQLLPPPMPRAGVVGPLSRDATPQHH